MASQSNTRLGDTSENNFIDFAGILNPPSDFFHIYDRLTLSQGNGPGDTSALQRPDPLLSSTSSWHIHRKNGTSTTDLLMYRPMNVDDEPVASSEAMDDETVDLFLDTESNSSGLESAVHEQANDDPQEIIETIPNNLPNAVAEVSDSMDLQRVITAIKRHPRPVIRMRVQPFAKQRFRYDNNDRRYLKSSRTHPMSINLPILDGCLTKAYQSFWIQGTLVTTRRNPHRKVFYHQHQMFYDGENSVQNGLRSFRIPLTDDDIRQRIKTFRYPSIIKSNLRDYNFELTPFDPLTPDDHTIYYTVDEDDQLTTVQKSKRFDRTYHTEELRIVFQVMIKERDQWHTTDVQEPPIPRIS